MYEYIHDFISPYIYTCAASVPFMSICLCADVCNLCKDFLSKRTSKILCTCGLCIPIFSSASVPSIYCGLCVVCLFWPLCRTILVSVPLFCTQVHPRLYIYIGSLYLYLFRVSVPGLKVFVTLFYRQVHPTLQDFIYLYMYQCAPSVHYIYIGLCK